MDPMEIGEEGDHECGRSSVNENCEDRISNAFSTREGEICLSVRTSIEEVLEEIRNKQGSIIGDYTIPTSFRLDTKWVDVLKALQVPYDPQKHVLKGHGRKMRMEDTVESFYGLYSRRLPYYTVNLLLSGNCRKRQQQMLYPQDPPPSFDSSLLGNLNSDGIRRSSRQRRSVKHKELSTLAARSRRKSALRRRMRPSATVSSSSAGRNNSLNVEEIAFPDDVSGSQEDEDTPVKRTKSSTSPLNEGSLVDVQVSAEAESVQTTEINVGLVEVTVSSSEPSHEPATTPEAVVNMLPVVPGTVSSNLVQSKVQNHSEPPKDMPQKCVMKEISPRAAPHALASIDQLPKKRCDAVENPKSISSDSHDLPHSRSKDTDILEVNKCNNPVLKLKRLKRKKNEGEVRQSPNVESADTEAESSAIRTPETAAYAQDSTVSLPIQTKSRASDVDNADRQSCNSAGDTQEDSSRNSPMQQPTSSAEGRRLPFQEPIDLSLSKTLASEVSPEDSSSEDCCVINDNKTADFEDTDGDSGNEPQEDLLIKPDLLTYINRRVTNKDLNKVYNEIQSRTEDMQIHQFATVMPYTTMFLTSIFNNSRILKQLKNLKGQEDPPLSPPVPLVSSARTVEEDESTVSASPSSGRIADD